MLDAMEGDLPPRDRGGVATASDTGSKRASLVLNSKLQETSIQNTFVLTGTYRFFPILFPRLSPRALLVFCSCWGSGGCSLSLTLPGLARVHGAMSELRGSCR